MNLTISIDEETIKAARIRAIRQGRSVNEVLREYLRRYARAELGGARLDDLYAQVDEKLSQSKRHKRDWSREDAYDHARIS